MYILLLILRVILHRFPVGSGVRGIAREWNPSVPASLLRRLYCVTIDRLCGDHFRGRGGVASLRAYLPIEASGFMRARARCYVPNRLNPPPPLRCAGSADWRREAGRFGH